MHKAITEWVFANCQDERKEGQTDTQFVYTGRKKAIGPFKRQLWDLATKDEILASQAAKVDFLFKQLGTPGSRALVEKYVKPVEYHQPLPEALKAAAAR
jgi:hypothetical protein